MSLNKTWFQSKQKCHLNYVLSKIFARIYRQIGELIKLKLLKSYCIRNAMAIHIFRINFALSKNKPSSVETIFFKKTKGRILRVTRMLHQSFRSRKLERMPSSSILEKSVRENYSAASCLPCRAQLRATFKIRLCPSQHSGILRNFTRSDETSSTAILRRNSQFRSDDLLQLLTVSRISQSLSEIIAIRIIWKDNLMLPAATKNHTREMIVRRIFKNWKMFWKIFQRKSRE